MLLTINTHLKSLQIRSLSSHHPDFQAGRPLLILFMFGKKTRVDKSEERLFLSFDSLNLEIRPRIARRHKESSYDLFEIPLDYR